MESLNIVIVNTQTVPSSGAGAASVNRILSYTKGLIKEGNNVCIISTAEGQDKCWHEYEGIPVQHLGRSKKGLINKCINLIVVLFRLLHSLSKRKKDVILFVTSNYQLIVILELYCKITGTKIVNERSEFPFVLMKKRALDKMLAPLYVNTAYKLLDGMIIMTRPLMDYYQKKAGKNCKFLEVPMTVDISRFMADGISNETAYGDYIAYCGNMGGTKDGVANLLKSFSLVEKRGYPLKLLLIGGTNNSDELNKLIELNNSLGNKSVIFLGRVDRNKMPQLLQGAKILTLSRPSGLQSTGGFPTKLGEYLSTGNPVLVTSVGDIPLYLKDKENAFVVPPDDYEIFADTICYIWDHYSEAKRIGIKGQNLARTIFNGDFQAKRIDKFLKEIVHE